MLIIKIELITFILMLKNIFRNKNKNYAQVIKFIETYY